MHHVDGAWQMRPDVLKQVDDIARVSRADIFLTITKRVEEDSQGKVVSSVENPEEGDATFHIYGDRLVEENARIRLLILLDRLQGLHVETLNLDLQLHPLVCGRQRKVISNIQSMTHTTIYFPPRYPGSTDFVPRGGQRRPMNEIIISGATIGEITLAKQKIIDQAQKLVPYGKEVGIESEKVDEILLQRPEKLAKMSDEHAAFINLNPIGRQNGCVRISAANVLNIERAARELMGVVSDNLHSPHWVPL
jgi:KH domain